MTEINRCYLFKNTYYSSDYTHVLDFKDASSTRAEWLKSNSEHIYFSNVVFNRFTAETATVKVQFTDASAGIDEFNYVYIKSPLYGKDNETYMEYYYFINSFEVVSSSSNLTVVQYNLELDIYSTYGDRIAMRPCNVRRMHVNRWSSDSDLPIYTSPSKDALECYTKFNKSIDISLKRSFSYKNNASESLTNTVSPYAVCLISYNDDDSKNHILYIPFPVFDVKNTSTLIPKFCKFTGETYWLYSIARVLNNEYITDFNLNPNAIQYISVMCNIDVTRVFNGLTANIIEIDGVSYLYYEQSTNKYYDSSLVGNNLSYIYTTNLTVEGLNKPVKPSDNEDYDVSHEPMLYNSPVRNLYFVTDSYDNIVQIPSVMNNGLYAGAKVVSHNMIDRGKSSTILTINSGFSDAVVSSAFSIPNTEGDIFSDAWQSYQLTQRDSDRKMMYSNMLTGALSNAGSTAVSAGIGYRSNMERALIADTNMWLMNDANLLQTLQQQRGIYQNMAQQAMRMSVVGGVTSTVASTIGSYMSQTTKEQSIKNEPSQLLARGNIVSAVMTRSIGISIAETVCDDNAFSRYANMFKMYGYAINGVIDDIDLRSRKYFNYIQTNGAVLTGNVPQIILAKMGAILDNGVTIWHMDYAAPYDYSKENIERGLIQ